MKPGTEVQRYREKRSKRISKHIKFMASVSHWFEGMFDQGFGTCVAEMWSPALRAMAAANVDGYEFKYLTATDEVPFVEEEFYYDFNALDDRLIGRKYTTKTSWARRA